MVQAEAANLKNNDFNLELKIKVKKLQEELEEVSQQNMDEKVDKVDRDTSALPHQERSECL